MAVKADLKAIGVLQSCDEDTTDELQDDPFGFTLDRPLEMSAEYAVVLEEDVVKKARSLVTSCRASGQRLEDFKKTISKGDHEGVFGPPPGMPDHALMREMEIRWSTTLLMIDRLLEMYLVRY